jgi:glucose/mannose-6-phosphate isomerase
MIDLDDTQALAKYDPDDYLGVVERFADQVRDAERRARAVEGLPSADGIDSVAVLGMGGSGISGDVARVVLADRVPLFFQTLKSYELPRWVGRNTLVFAMSYSGDTEETLTTFDEAAKDRGARTVIVSTGGQLSRLGRELEMPIIEIPAGLQPRGALGYLSIPILVVIEMLGLGPPMRGDIDEAVGLMEERAEQFGRNASNNAAKNLARELFDKIPIIYGTEGLAEVAAYRWKCQFNEVAQVPSWWNAFPELNHNEVVGWDEVASVTQKHLALIVLRHPGEHPRNADRIEATLPLIEGNLAFTEMFTAKGSSPLARLFDLIYFGDFAATYLALLQEVDPSQIEIITKIKKRLAGRA